MSVSAIIFDCDGVLIDSERIYIAVERELLAKMGLEYELGAYQTKFVGLQNRDFFRALELDYLKLDKGPFPPSFATELKTKAWKRFETELNSVANVHSFLDQFSGPVAVASSSSIETLHEKLKITELHHRFDPHIYSGEHVENGKPAPDLFLHAAAKLDHKPGECLVIEDSINGVVAGLDAGMQVWGFTGGGHADEGLTGRLEQAGAHAVFDSFEDIKTQFSNER